MRRFARFVCQLGESHSWDSSRRLRLPVKHDSAEIHVKWGKCDFPKLTFFYSPSLLNLFIIIASCYSLHKPSAVNNLHSNEPIKPVFLSLVLFFYLRCLLVCRNIVRFIFASSSRRFIIKVSFEKAARINKRTDVKIYEINVKVCKHIIKHSQVHDRHTAAFFPCQHQEIIHTCFQYIWLCLIFLRNLCLYLEICCWAEEGKPCAAAGGSNTFCSHTVKRMNRTVGSEIWSQLGSS